MTIAFVQAAYIMKMDTKGANMLAHLHGCRGYWVTGEGGGR